jgi:drug/metabolite transporter (DMT)-like permease
MRLKNFLGLAFLACLWGPSFVFIKVAVQEIPPLKMVVGRVGIAAVLLYLVLRLQGRSLPPFGPVWKHFAFLGFMHNALPFALFNWGEQYIDSALAAILNGTTPLFTILLAHFFVADDRLTPAKVSGALIGFGGLLLLIGPSLLGGLQATTLGLLAVAMATICYAVAIVYSRLSMRGLPPLVAPTAQLGMATLFALPLSLFIEQPYRLPMPSWAALGSLLVLAAIGTALAFGVYYFLIERIGASAISMVTYIIPVVGIILGVVLLDEALAWNAYAGCALILCGVMFANGLIRLPALWRRLAGAAA